MLVNNSNSILSRTVSKLLQIGQILTLDMGNLSNTFNQGDPLNSRLRKLAPWN